MQTQDPARRGDRTPLAWGAVVLWVALLSGLVILGADLLWVVALGDVARGTGGIPTEIPNVAAPQIEWQNPVLLAELFLSWVNSLGWAGLAALHVALVFLTLVILVLDGRRAGGTDLRLAIVVSLVAVGASATLVVVRFPTLSLVPFVLLVALLRAFMRGHRRAFWWVPPLMILWGNLHGAVLVGLAVVGVFVVAAGREFVLQRVVVGLTSLLALVLTSAGTRTPEYYLTALGNEAAVRGTDLWARPSLTHPLDVLMIASAVALVLMAARSLRLWEWLVVAGLAVATLSAARHGVWLLLFLAPVASVRRGRPLERQASSRLPDRRAAVLGVAVVAALGAVVGGQLARRGDAVRPPGHDLVAKVASLAGGGTVLAVEPEAETLMQQGVRVWVANPIDAFGRPTQGDFLDFLHDCRIPEAPIDVVVVNQRCVDQVARQGWSVSFRSGGLTVLTK